MLRVMGQIKYPATVFREYSGDTNSGISQSFSYVETGRRSWKLTFNTAMVLVAEVLERAKFIGMKRFWKRGVK
jgi:hypothetical protein